MKKQILQKTLLTILAVASVPAMASASSRVKEYIGFYNTSNTSTYDITFNETESAFKYLSSTITVQELLAESGGSGTTCSWCQLTATLGKKNWLGLYSNIGSKTITTTSTGRYTGPTSSNGGADSFRIRIKNENHYKNNGQAAVQTRDE